MTPAEIIRRIEEWEAEAAKFASPNVTHIVWVRETWKAGRFAYRRVLNLLKKEKERP